MLRLVPSVRFGTLLLGILFRFSVLLYSFFFFFFVCLFVFFFCFIVLISLSFAFVFAFLYVCCCCFYPEEIHWLPPLWLIACGRHYQWP